MKTVLFCWDWVGLGWVLCWGSNPGVPYLPLARSLVKILLLPPGEDGQFRGGQRTDRAGTLPGGGRGARTLTSLTPPAWPSLCPPRRQNLALVFSRQLDGKGRPGVLFSHMLTSPCPGVPHPWNQAAVDQRSENTQNCRDGAQTFLLFLIFMKLRIETRVLCMLSNGAISSAISPERFLLRPGLTNLTLNLRLSCPSL